MLNTYFYKKFFVYVKLLNKANIIIDKVNQLEKNMTFENLEINLDPLEEKFVDLTFAIIRIVSVNKCKCGNYYLDNKSGLIQLCEHSDIIKTELNIFKNKFGNTFDNIKIIRNKIEHEPHNIERTKYAGNDRRTEFTFSYQSENMINPENTPCTAGNLREVILELNRIFNLIINYIKDELIINRNDYPNDYQRFFATYNKLKFKEKETTEDIK